MKILYLVCLLSVETDLSVAVSLSFDAALEEIGIENEETYGLENDEYYIYLCPYWDNELDSELGNKVMKPDFRLIHIFEYLIPSKKTYVDLEKFDQKYEWFIDEKIEAEGCSRTRVMRSNMVGLRVTDSTLWVIFSFTKTWLNEVCVESFRPTGTSDHFVFVEFNLQNESVSKVRVFNGFRRIKRR